MRALQSAVIALACLPIFGCDYLNQPTPVVLARCIAIAGGSIGQPLSVLEKALTAAGSTARWQRGTGRSYYLHISKHDPLTAKTVEMAFEIEQSDEPSDTSNCGPGRATITRATVNGDTLDIFSAQSVVIGVLQQYLGHPLNQPDPKAPLPQPTAQTVNENSTDELEAEAEDDRAFYEDRARKAREKLISIADPDYSYCCVTIGNVFDRLKAQGAQVTIDTFDDGTIVLDAKGNKPLWRGLQDLSLRFEPISGDPEVVLRSITSGGHEVASQGQDAKIDPGRYFHENFTLSSRPEPSPVG